MSWVSLTSSPTSLRPQGQEVEHLGERAIPPEEPPLGPSSILLRLRPPVVYVTVPPGPPVPSVVPLTLTTGRVHAPGVGKGRGSTGTEPGG